MRFNRSDFTTMMRFINLAFMIAVYIFIINTFNQKDLNFLKLENVTEKNVKNVYPETDAITKILKNNNHHALGWGFDTTSFNGCFRFVKAENNNFNGEYYASKTTFFRENFVGFMMMTNYFLIFLLTSLFKLNSTTAYFFEMLYSVLAIWYFNFQATMDGMFIHSTTKCPTSYHTSLPTNIIDDIKASCNFGINFFLCQIMAVAFVGIFWIFLIYVRVVKNKLEFNLSFNPIINSFCEFYKILQISVLHFFPSLIRVFRVLDIIFTLIRAFVMIFVTIFDQIHNCFKIVASLIFLIPDVVQELKSN